MPAKTTSRLDPRRPLVLDVRELGRRPGSMRTVRRTVPAPDGLGVELARVPTGEPVELDLRLESVVEGVLVSGTATAAVAGECARCLGPVADRVTVDLQELFAYADSATEETTEEDEISHLVGDHLDLEPVVRDAVVLALPLSPLCREDCARAVPRLRRRPGRAPRGPLPRRTRRSPLGGARRARRPRQHQHRESGVDSGSPEAPDVPEQHPVPPVAVEDFRPDAGPLREPRLPQAEAAAHGLCQLRDVRQQAGPRGLIPAPRPSA